MERSPADNHESAEPRTVGTIYTADGEEALRVEPTEKPGVYNVPNGVLTTTYINMAEVDAASGRQTPPLDWC